MEITLPSGATVTLRDPKEIKQKDRKKVLKVFGESGDDVLGALVGADTVLALAVQSWSFDLPLPSEQLDSLDELQVADYDALSEAAKTISDVIFPNLEPNPDPKVTTPSSNG